MAKFGLLVMLGPATLKRDFDNPLNGRWQQRQKKRKLI
jgi:hypothetical protein